jgi:hypothetical protein
LIVRIAKISQIGRIHKLKTAFFAAILMSLGGCKTSGNSAAGGATSSDKGG